MYTIIDIETTGLMKFDSNGVLIPDLLEFGYINVDNNLQIINSGTLYFYEPWFDIENDAQRIHGLTRQFLQEHATDNIANAAAMQAMLTNTTVIGKNSDKFDLPFIKYWIEKMYGRSDMDIAITCSNACMKGYNGGTVLHDNNTNTLDLQKVYSPIWKSAHSITGNKRGTLSEYIQYEPDGYQLVNQVYEGLNKERVTGAHGALYDCAMTYVVFLWYIIRSGQ